MTSGARRRLVLASTAGVVQAPPVETETPLYLGGCGSISKAAMDLELYEEWLAGNGMAPRTVGLRVRFAQQLLSEWGTFDKPPQVVAQWLSGYTGWSRNTYLNHLNSLYGWLIETGQADRNPAARLRRAPTPSPRPSPLTPLELARVVEAAVGDLRAWLLLGALAGLRCHEIAKIKGEHITETTLYVLGKGGKDAMVPTHPALWQLAQTYPREGHWFPSPYQHREHVTANCIGNRVRDHFRAQGITPGSVHRLRHTFGTSLMEGGVPVRVIQELMRHSSLDTTMRYLAATDERKTAAVHALTFGLPVAS